MLPSRYITGFSNDASIDVVKMKDCGSFDCKSFAIRIRRDLSTGQQWATFWHELLHSYEEESATKMSHAKLDRLATWLYQLFQRNEWTQPGCCDLEPMKDDVDMICTNEGSNADE